MGDVKNLVEKSQNNFHWSPAQCLRDLLQEIESGELDVDRLMIGGAYRDEDGTLRPFVRLSQLTPEGEVALADVLHRIALDDYLTRD